MNEYVGSLNGDCISSLPPPPSYERQLINNSPFWNTQMTPNNNSGGANIQRNQQLFDTPTTSQNANFDIIGQQQQFPQFNTEGRSPIIPPSPYFNISQQQQQQMVKQFQDSQRKNGGIGGPNNNNIIFNQEFQRPESNFSSPGQFEQIQQKIQQQISSPSVTSTADLLAASGQGNIQQNFQQQQQLCFQQMQQNGMMFDPQQSNNNNGDVVNNIPANFMNGGGNCNSPMFRQSIQINNNNNGVQQSIPSPLIGQQQNPQMMIPQQNNPSLWQGMPPQQMLRMPLPPSNGICPQQIRGNNCGEMEPPPFQMIQPPNNKNNGGMPPLPFGRLSLLFTTDMANKAVIDVQRRQFMDLPHWHAQNLSEWHMTNPSTSKAFYSSQMYQLQQQQIPIRMNNNKSPHSVVVPSRSNKRKISSTNSTIQEQNNSFSPLSNVSQQINNNNNFVLPQGLNNTNLLNNNNNVVLQRYGGAKDVNNICDSSTNTSVDMIFKRPSSASTNNNDNFGIQQRQEFYCHNNQTNSQINQNLDCSTSSTNCSIRLDDENPLKKMEIMASKTLNEQPTNNKMARLICGEEEDVNYRLNNICQQQQQAMGDAARQEKIRKLHEIETSLLHLSSSSSSSFENNNNNNSNNNISQQQQFLQMQNSSNNFNGGIIPPQHLDVNNIEMMGGAGQFKQQQQHPFFQNMIPSPHFNNPTFVGQQQQQMLIPQQKFNNNNNNQQFDINNFKLQMTQQQ